MTSHTLDEILSQPASWASALAGVAARADAIRDLLARYAAGPLLIAACGSPYFLSLSAAALLRRATGRAWLATPASELVLHAGSLIPSGAAPLLLTFSRSGETSEVLAAVRAARRRGGAVIAVGCDAASTLLREADVAVEIPAGREVSVVQTRSFAGMFVAAQAIAALVGGADLAGLLTTSPRLVARAREATAAGAPLGDLARDAQVERAFLLASGPRYGLACEAALKLKEMSLTPAEAFHTLEFRHGPMALADRHALVIGLVGDEGAAQELAVLRHVRRLGARVAVLAERAPAEELDAVFALESGLPEAVRDAFYLPPLQLMAYERAVSRGLDPDTPRHLSAYVTLDGLAEA